MLSVTACAQTVKHRADYLKGGSALHLAALNCYSRCIRLLVADYIPNNPNVWNILKERSRNEELIAELDKQALCQVINRPADGSRTALHMAALNGNAESVQLLLDLGASVSEVTEDGTTVELIGSKIVVCCRLLAVYEEHFTSSICRCWKHSTFIMPFVVGMQNVVRRTPLTVPRSWHRNCLEISFAGNLKAA